MEDLEFVYEGVRFYAKQIPCAVFFEYGGEIRDMVPFSDVEEACEYLAMCGYRKDKRELALWKKRAETAFIVYFERCKHGKEA